MGMHRGRENEVYSGENVHEISMELMAENVLRGLDAILNHSLDPEN
jgi:hypothetical protein